MNSVDFRLEGSSYGPAVVINSNSQERNEQRAAAIAGFGFTERQARFLVTVMVHAGVFVERQYCAFANIVHGQKTHDFVERRHVTMIEVGPRHQGRMFHVGYKPLYAAIGQTDNRHRKPAPAGKMVERLMLLDAVLDRRTLTWLGTEQDKRRYFSRCLGARLKLTEFPQVRFGRGEKTTTRYFPDKMPIGVEPETGQHVFVYLVTSPTPMDFRLFLLRHLELLRGVGRWTIRVLFPSPFAASIRVSEAAARDHLAAPLPPAAAEELVWYFAERKRREQSGANIVDERFARAGQAFQGPRFRTLYRHWQTSGNSTVWATASPSLKDAVERGDGRLEFVALTRQYLHLASQIGVS